MHRASDLNSHHKEFKPRLIQPQSSIGGNTSRFSAVVMPDSQVPLGFRIPGYVVSLKQVRGQDGRMRDIAEGDAVSQGTVLVRIRPAEYEDKVRQASSQVEAAEAAAQRATLDFERAKRLYDSQSLTKPDFDAAQGAVRRHAGGSASCSRADQRGANMLCAIRL